MKTKPTILIADRNPRVRDLLKRELSFEGYNALTAKNAREVASAMQYGSVDAVILDPDLPDASSLSVYACIQKRTPPMPVLVLSCNTESVLSLFKGADVSTVEKGEGSLEIIKQFLKRYFS